MKKILRITRGRIVAVVAAVLLSVGLSSCYVDVGWMPSPPSGWSETFYDSRLTGYWQLMEINGTYVSRYDTNYLYFGGAGRGRYYYYDRGQAYWENTAYWCQESVNSASRYQINLQYETTGSPTTMNYWFEDGGYVLCMQWFTGNRVQTYVYKAINYAPW